MEYRKYQSTGGSLAAMISASSLFVWEFSKIHPGLVLVFIGVAGEGMEIFVKIFFKKWSKKHELPVEIIGAACWTVLVIGLWLEFSDAAKSDNKVVALQQQIEQTRTNVAKIDPRKQPVVSFSAYAMIEVRHPKSKISSFPYKEFAVLTISSATKAGSLEFFSDKLLETWIVDGKERVLRFDLFFDKYGEDSEYRLFGKGQLTAEDLDTFDVFLPYNRGEVIKGKLEMTVNSSVKKEFEIPPQNFNIAIITNGTFTPVNP